MKTPPEEIKDWLDYNPETGAFYWKRTRQGCRKQAGEEAGSIVGTGYRSIQFDGVRHQAHRIAWWMIHGWLPEEIDHINMDRADNRLVNLRPADSSRNKCNRLHGTGASGLKGVHPSGRRERPWKAYITLNGRYRHLGHFHTPEEAGRVYDAAARQHFGEFARCNFEEESRQ